MSLPLHDYPMRALRGLSSAATRNIAIYCAEPIPKGQRWDDARCEHLTFNIGNRARLRAEIRRRAVRK